jgi:LacI family transcriptional regulator
LRVTIKEIAAICGLSIGTVDRAMHGRQGINPETRDRVLTVSRQLGYRPHLLARSLVTGSTMSIGVIVPNLKNPFFSELVEVMQIKARAAGYHVYMMLSEFDAEEEKESLERLRSLNVDGIIILPVSRGRSFHAYMKSLGTPIVTISNRVSQQWPWVGIDDRKAMRDAVRFVISRGYANIVFVTLEKGLPSKSLPFYSDEQRILGYKEALREADGAFTPLVVTDTEMIRTIHETRLQGERRTCIVCSCDAVALEVMNVLKGYGIGIPDTVGLMGFDNLEELKYITPRLATVATPIQKIGEEAFDAFLAALREDCSINKVLEHRIIEGETV